MNESPQKKADSLEVDEDQMPIGHNDPVLQELWAVKARINEEAGYDVGRLLKEASKINLDDLIAAAR